MARLYFPVQLGRILGGFFLLLLALSPRAFAEENQKPRLDYVPLEAAEYAPPPPSKETPPPPGKEDEVRVSYKVGQGLAVKSADEKFVMRFSLRMQPRYQYIWTEGPNRPNINTFSLTRLRSVISGNVINKDMKYFFQTEFYPAVVLRDGFIDYRVVDEFQVMLGQSFVPFCRELLSSTVKTEFISSSEALIHFCPIRDIGLNFHGDVTKWLTYDAFVMNGEGINNLNSNKDFFFGTRLTAHVLGKRLPYQEGDLDYSKSPRLAAGLGVMYDTGSGKEITLGQDNRIARATADIAFAYYGFYFQGATYYIRNATLKKNDLGFTGQTGYFLIPKKLEMAGRFSTVIPGRTGSAFPMTGRTKGSTIPLYEVAGGLSYFPFGSNEFKLQADYTALYNVDGVRNRNDNRLQFQVQVFF
ncbi:MAG: porin [Deltaproteobacteria bacterium]|nr:porin [Deltaproteobacteria bacterium]